MVKTYLNLRRIGVVYMLTLSAVYSFVYAETTTEIKQTTHATLSITKFIDKVWQQHPLVQQIHAKVQMSQSQQRVASQRLYNPQLELATENKNNQTGQTNQYGISQTLDWSGKSIAAGKVASFELRAVIAEKDQVQQQIALGVLSALSDYQTAGKIQQLSQQRTQFMQWFSTLANKRFTSGDSDQSSNNLAQLAYAQALMQDADAQMAYVTSQQQLEIAMGFPINTFRSLPVLAKTVPKINSYNIDDIIKKLPEIRILEAKQQASFATIEQARINKNVDPTISLMGGKDEGEDVIGLSVSIPINLFNRYQAQVDVASYQNIAQEKALQNAIYIARAKLSRTQKNYQLVTHAWRTWQTSGAQTLAQQVSSLDKKFKLGELSATDYLVQLQQTLDTQMAAQYLQNKVWQAWFNWLEASATLNQWED